MGLTGVLYQWYSTLSMKGAELRKLRNQLRLTQFEMAGKLGVTSTTVARWERGERKISEPVAQLVRLFVRDAASKPKED